MQWSKVGGIVAVWVVALLVECLRLPTFGAFVLLDVIILLMPGGTVGVRALMWLGLLGVTFAMSRGMRRRLLRWAVPVGGLLVIVMCFNWSVIAPRWWFATHRPFYEAAVSASVDSSDYYGEPLPIPLRWLSADGNVSSQCAVCDGGGPDAPRALFFAQWFGIPDDAGGYAYSPDRRPAGMDMFGMACLDPVDLGDGWWMCGM